MTNLSTCAVCHRSIADCVVETDYCSDSCKWDDWHRTRETLEVLQTQTVGDTTYLRGYVGGTDKEVVYADRDGRLDFVVDDDIGSPRRAYRALTGETAPTKLPEQLLAEAQQRSCARN